MVNNMEMVLFWIVIIIVGIPLMVSMRLKQHNYLNKMDSKCRNCGATVGHSNYCPKCGTKNN